VDRTDTATRSRVMASITGKNTLPERMLRHELSKRGARYRLHQRAIPGRPDISHSGRQIAIFVDGCFWHGCPKHYRQPKSRLEYWIPKLERNQARRRQVRSALATTGWKVIEVWECQIRENPTKVAGRLVRLWA
jgi:DNA mismatch endonuclease (patch repair protein)